MAFETILAQQNRNPVTNAVTPGRQLAAGNGGQVNFRMPVGSPDITDPTMSVTYTFQLSNDNVSYRDWIGPETWVGNTLGRDGNPAPPQCSGSIGPGAWWVRIKYTIAKRLSIGLDMEIIENV